MEQAKDDEDASLAQLLPHPADEKYGTLKADLQVVNDSQQEYQVVEQYVKVMPMLLESYCIALLQSGRTSMKPTESDSGRPLESTAPSQHTSNS